MSNDDITPLLSTSGDGSTEESVYLTRSSATKWILLTGFLVSFATGLTQVPYVVLLKTSLNNTLTLNLVPLRIIYLFREMTCDAFYSTHPPHSEPGNRCSRPEIDSAVAIQISTLGISTSVCGILNLLLCGVFIQRFGLASTLFIQLFTLALRVACQAVAVSVGGRDGMILIQATQLIGIVGGPKGYL